jgi:hypothetical protein
VVVERNVIYGSTGNNDGGLDGGDNRSGGIGGVTHGSGQSSRQVIIRRNVMYDNLGGMALFDHWMGYHNTLVGNNRDYTGPSSTFPDTGKPMFTGVLCTSSGVLQNNIMVGHNTAEVALQPEYLRAVDYNLYFHPDHPVVLKDGADNWAAHDLASWQALLAGYGSLAGQDAHSIEADPMFVSGAMAPVGEPDGFDWRLSSGSPAIDGGGPLTHAVGSGAGTALTVESAHYFFDGYGAVTGDRIQVGNNAPVVVTAVDYDTNTLTLADDLTWSDGDPVSLPYAGAAPDLGAFEYVGD